MATYQTYQEVGVKEDISDIITNISPRKTPFLSGVGNDKVTQPLFQWQEDSLRNVNGTSSAVVEGAAATYITVNPTVMRQNYTQIFMEPVQVSGTVQATLAYGRAKELAYQMAKSASQLKRDLENALVGTSQSAAIGATGTARLLGGYQAQISQTPKAGSANVTVGTADGHQGNVYQVGTTSPNFSETALINNLQQIFVEGGEPTRIQVTPANSIILANFAQAAGKYQRFIPNDGESSREIINVVNLYVSPFGEQKVEVNRFLAAKNTLVYEPDMWNLATLRPWTRETLAKLGDAEQQMIVGEFSLKHKNFLASGLILDNAAALPTLDAWATPVGSGGVDAA